MLAVSESLQDAAEKSDVCYARMVEPASHATARTIYDLSGERAPDESNV